MKYKHRNDFIKKGPKKIKTEKLKMCVPFFSNSFSVQWSTRADFMPVTGEREMLDIAKPNCTIELTQGRRYFFRAACGNLKGFGAFLTSTPASVVPSSWREIDNKEARFVDEKHTLITSRLNICFVPQIRGETQTVRLSDGRNKTNSTRQWYFRKPGTTS